MKGIDAPLNEEQWENFLKIYDKKGEGSINWDDILSDHKYVHAVSKLFTVNYFKGMLFVLEL